MADVREHIDNDHVISVLEKLIENCRDGQAGYRDAATHVKNPELRTLFNQLSTVRAEFAGELENEVIRLGHHDPDRKPTTAGALHRKWIDLKSAMGAGDHSILSSVESGEDALMKLYQDALNDKLPLDIKDILRRQSEQVTSDHDRIRTLRDQSKAA
ncbi:MAG: PA2169 family four-helix-bundle protein [Terriglobia bacterium]|jgi:uncharacterized protein (TIGR02284 family)|nr:PA2169 family four-helix-bundle protein [Terriglobia bacterium]